MCAFVTYEYESSILVGEGNLCLKFKKNLDIKFDNLSIIKEGSNGKMHYRMCLWGSIHSGLTYTLLKPATYCMIFFSPSERSLNVVMSLFVAP